MQDYLERVQKISMKYSLEHGFKDEPGLPPNVMTFKANHKTVEYISILLSKKTELSQLYKKLSELRSQKLELGYFYLNSEKISFDRNVIVYLQIMRNLLTLFKENRKKGNKNSADSMRIYNEILGTLDAIEIKYCGLNNKSHACLPIKPYTIFSAIFNMNNRSDALYDKTHELALEYLVELETQACAVINHLDNIKFDIKSYSAEFFDKFMSMRL